jgi:hypothetical protein
MESIFGHQRFLVADFLEDFRKTLLTVDKGHV